MLEEFEQSNPAWTSGLRTAMERFEERLDAALRKELMEVSASRRREFLEPAQRASRQLAQSLQDFRDRLSERMLETPGVPLKTAEMGIEVREPREPDIRVGRVFDRNWGLLSWAIPVHVFRNLVRRHFRHRIERAVEINLARLVSQWESALHAALRAMLDDAVRRLEALIHIVEQLLQTGSGQAEEIRADLARLDEALQVPVRGSRQRGGSTRLEP